jgi:hypothetical protein
VASHALVSHPGTRRGRFVTYYMARKERDFDPKEHAGNEADVCKHPALIAALDKTLARRNSRRSPAGRGRRPFQYADLFAGYAETPLLKSGEWKTARAILRVT